MSTVYTIENDLLKVSVTTWGAQICSAVRKCDGVEHIWQANPDVWGYHGPVLFPYAGKLTDGKLCARGQVWENAPQHGFARNLEHTLVRQSSDEIVLELVDTPETLAQWPYRFALVSTFRLEGDRLIHRLTVENRDDEDIRFGIGYHPGFTIPFDSSHQCTDYELRFDSPQSPMCLGCLPKGLLNGNCTYFGSNIQTIPITPSLFANDSHCMTGLTAKTLGLYEKGTGRGVECDISGFPYTLIWSKPNWPMEFVCIEPWMSLPGTEEGSTQWSDKPAAATVAPGRSWSVDLAIRFTR